MTEKRAPDSPGAIQARLKYLKEKKAVLDELIDSLERYSEYRKPQWVAPNCVGNARRVAGAA